MDAIHVVGAGGIGCAVGYVLARAGAPVVLVESSRERLAWGREHGVWVDRQPPVWVPLVSFESWQPPAGGVVLLCTKCYDNPDVLARLPDTTLLVPIQNGFDPTLAARPAHVAGIASFVSEARRGQAHTHITRRGKLHLGPAGGDGTERQRLRDLAARLAGVLGQAPFGVTVVEDVLPYRYTKLMYNAALCPLAAAGGLDNGAVLRWPRVRELFFALLRENHAILKRAGLPLGQVGPLAPATVARILARPWLARPLAFLFARSLRGTYCSMSGDLPAGRCEADYFNGHLVRLAGDFPCPLNRLVLALLERMLVGRLPPGRDRLDELWRAFRTTPQCAFQGTWGYPQRAGSAASDTTRKKDAAPGLRVDRAVRVK
jgi:2-dehydropantoate 2-reductase